MKSTLNVPEHLAFADWLVFALVLGLTLAAVWWGNARRRRLPLDAEASMLDLLLMGRRLTLPLFTATLVATWYGGIFAVTELAFTTGVYNWVTQGMFWYVVYLLFAFLLVHRVRSTRARTMPELLEVQFGPLSAKVGAVFNLLNVLPLIYVITLGIFLQLLFGGPVLLWMALGTGVVLLYSAGGGLRSVVYSDVVQFVVMCAAVALVLLVSFFTFGGLDYLANRPHIGERYWRLDGGYKLTTTLVWGFIALGTLVDPNFYQRCLAADSDRTARRGILLATLVWLLFDFCTTFGAMYALAQIPQADPKEAYLVYSIQLLPAGLRGFFLAGVLATILSTLDSYLFLSGTVVAYDLAPRRWKGKVWVERAGIVLMGGVTVLIAARIRGGELVDVWKTLGGFATACLLVPVLIGFAWPRRVSDRHFVCASVLGSLSMLAGFLLQRDQALRIWIVVQEPFYAGLAGSVAGFVIFPLLRALLRVSARKA